MANDYDRLIETVDEEGNIVKFELIDIVLVDEDEYGILVPADSQDDENNEAVIMRLKKVDEDFVFEYIDDDAEFQKVVDAIEELEDDEDEDFDDEE